MACEASFEYKVFGFLQQAKHGGVEVTTQNMGVLIAPQVPQHGQLIVGQNGMVSHNACPEVFIAG